MLLPLALAIVTAAVLIVVIGPLLHETRMAPERPAFDCAVYRDQLAELERDRARGLIGATEAETARLEIERRILASDRAAPLPPAHARPLPWLAAVLALVVAGGAAALYLRIGAPGVPDLPYAARRAELARAAAAPEDAEASAAALEKQLAAKPGDVDGWAQLARIDAELQRWQRSADAYRHAVALAPGRVDIAAALGEVLVMGADGMITPAARDTFTKVLAKDSGNAMARYYLALGDAQGGKTQEAIAAWQKLAAEAPAGAPIRADLKRRIAEAAQSGGIAPPPLAPPAPAAAPPAGAAAPGPDAAQMAAAAKMTPEQRQTMIKGMVAQLAARLQAAPGDPDGWVRLGRAYGVLGERDKAVDAYERAAKLDPKDVQIPLQEVRLLLASQKLETQLTDREMALLHRIEVLDPAQPEALWYLGLAAAQSHRPDEAKGYWQRLLAALPADAPERKTVTAALGALKPK
ncbi:MAG TPA: c-type cytochrome biogenesis protein CcmI [Stellaceae bacterium]|nr:c-type cytochrome biogenesis protein CcmI [Stellaceae bacterium]